MSFRSDFPIFSHHPDLVYLDSGATSQKPQTVIDAVSTYLAQSNSNIHRGAYHIAEHSEDLYRQSKERFAQFVGGSSPREVIYQHNATMCFNLLTQSLITSGYLTPGDNIIIPVYEHHANIVPRQMIADAHNIQIRRRDIDTETYELNRDQLPQLIDDRTRLLTMSSCSNVTGYMPDLTRIRSLIGPDMLWVIDASQMLGKYPINVSAIGADVLIGTAHKMMGLTGLGMMRIRRTILRQLDHPARGGGGMIADVTRQGYTAQSGIEGREAGTPHVAGAVSLLAAMDYIDSVGGIDTISQHDQALTTYALKKLSTIDNLTIIGSDWSSLTKNIAPGQVLESREHGRGGPACGRGFSRAGVISFIIDGQSKTSIAQHCADHDIAIRCGGHCTFPLRHAIGHDGGCRISFHLYNTTEDIDRLVDTITPLAIER